MELARTPARITTLVAGVAVCNRHTTQALVGNVIGGLAICRRVAATVASRTLVRHRQLGVVPAAGLPA